MKCLALLLSIGLIGAASAGEMNVLSVEPAARMIGAPVGGAVAVQFDRAVDPTSVDDESFRVFGRWSGRASGTLALEDGGTTVRFVPAAPFSAGELVRVQLSRNVAGVDASPLRDAGYTFQFWTRARESSMAMNVIQTLSSNAGPESSRPYGGLACDLDNDGYLDMTIVNEDTSDLRIFLNGADGTGSFDPFLQPPAPVSQQASPSESADFDGDGNADVCVANIATDTVSILLGNGDGTFQPQQEIAVGDAPRGIAVLDVDGDGDTDIVNTNANSSNLSLLRNNGSGVFGSPLFFEGGGSAEWALASSDMNEDGILDLVVGARSSQEIIVLADNGDGTFTEIGSQSAGGLVWMIVVGDVNGDGHEDVATANSQSDNGAVLFGDGAGGLAAPQIYVPDPFPLAVDLGDLNGDGFLDLTLSCFGGDWFIYTNDGDGTYTFFEQPDAPIAASCTLLLDIDNDRDLDLALIDELADTIDVMRSSGSLPLEDINRDGTVNVDDLVAVILAWGPCAATGPCAADVDGNGAVDVDDLVAVILGWSGRRA